MAALICEVVYRGIFQKNLAARIARGIVLSARKSGRWGTTMLSPPGQAAAASAAAAGVMRPARAAWAASSSSNMIAL